MRYDATVLIEATAVDVSVSMYIIVNILQNLHSTGSKHAAHYSSCLASSDGFSSSLTMLAMSPTCFLVLTSRLLNRDRIAASFIVNP